MNPGSMADFSQDSIWLVLVKAAAILVFLLVSVLFALWFERRLIARFQQRLGPNVHGPAGLAQSIPDALKLLLKEDIAVKAADKAIYLIAPCISVICSFLVFAVIPFGPAVWIPGFNVMSPLQLTDLPVSVLYILGVTALGVYGIVLGGWSSGSTYPLLGAVRSTAQVISYELSMSLALVSVFLVAGSMSTSQIVNSQDNLWWALPLFPAFVVYIISMVGEVNRLPFDLPEAEGELVAGYQTEYSSMKFAWFYLAEYINMLNVSAVATTLFLGGWRAPWGLELINDGMLNTGWWPVLWFLIKLWLLMGFFVWVRGTLLRFRYDQFMNFGWKVLIPVGLAWLVLLAIWQGIQNAGGLNLGNNVRPILIGVAVVVFATAVVLFVRGNREEALAKNAAQVPLGERPQEPFDAFAGGYPVPPLPGQKLPPSPRRSSPKPSPVGAMAGPSEQERTDD